MMVAASDAPTGDIAHGKREPLLVHRDQAVPVASDVHSVRAGHIARRDLEVRNDRVALREQGALQRLGDGALGAVKAVQPVVEPGNGLRVLFGQAAASDQLLGGDRGGDGEEHPGDQEDPRQLGPQRAAELPARARDEGECRVAERDRFAGRVA